MDSPTSSTSPSSPLYLLAGWRQHKSLTSSPTSSLSSSISSTWSTSSNNTGASSTQASLTCAFPSWPCRPSLSLSPTLSAQSTSSISSSNSYSTWDVPNSFISDEDLFPEELDTECPYPYLDEAPAPPREPLPVVAPLPPLYASSRPKMGKRRRSSKQKVAKFAKPMSPISE